MTEIQKLSPSRWEDYKKLRLGSLKESPLAFGAAFDEEVSFGAAEWRKRMKNVDFAMADETPVGTIACTFSKEVKFRHIAEIYSFYVLPEYRGKGIGKALLDHVLRKAKRNPRIIKVRLFVNSQQRAAVEMYKKTGFAIVGRLVKEMKVGDRFYTMLVMEKRIR